MFGDSLWAFVVVGGFVILLAAILFAKLGNKRTAREEAHTEAATRASYAEQAAEDEARTP